MVVCYSLRTRGVLATYSRIDILFRVLALAVALFGAQEEQTTTKDCFASDESRIAALERVKEGDEVEVYLHTSINDAIKDGWAGVKEKWGGWMEKMKDRFKKKDEEEEEEEEEK